MSVTTATEVMQAPRPYRTGTSVSCLGVALLWTVDADALALQLSKPVLNLGEPGGLDGGACDGLRWGLFALGEPKRLSQLA